MEALSSRRLLSQANRNRASVTAVRFIVDRNLNLLLVFAMVDDDEV